MRKLSMGFQIVFGVLLSPLLSAALANAQIPAPDALVRQMNDEVIAALRQDRFTRSADSAMAVALLENKVVPHFDFRRITQIAMGPNWRRAKPEQQDELTRQFKNLLVRTYSGALASYRDQTVEFRPLKMAAEANEVTVHTLIRRSGSEPLAIDYDLERGGNGWKIYDVRVAGMSLVSTYRTTFAEEVRNHGIEGLIAVLETKNRLGPAKPSNIAM